MFEVTKYCTSLSIGFPCKPVVVSRRCYRWKWLADIMALLVPPPMLVVYWSEVKLVLRVIPGGKWP